MIIKRYALMCNRCKRVAPLSSATGQAWFETSGGAHSHGKHSGWLRIPRKDPRDTSAGQRGMDICPACRAAHYPDVTS